jgi:hypothetical protein
MLIVAPTGLHVVEQLIKGHPINLTKKKATIIGLLLKHVAKEFH